jgi:ABC-type glycerol-3-phosphate transport system permease component
LVKPWASLPTSHDVAKKARVSQSTVSRALRGDPRVSDATRTRVVSAARRLGYVRSERGRSLSTRRTNRIGVGGLSLSSWGAVFSTTDLWRDFINSVIYSAGTIVLVVVVSHGGVAHRHLSPAHGQLRALDPRGAI